MATLTALNGRLPAAALTVADTGPRGPQQLRVDAAASWARMIAAGMPAGHLRSGYRTRAEQEAEVIRANNGLTPSAAPVGKSMHGEGLAGDVDEPARSWLWAHGAPFGWVVGRVKGERWHVEYEPTRDQHGATPITPPAPAPAQPAPAPPEDIMATRAELQADIAAALAPIAAALARRERWVKFEGSNLAWIDLGTCRRRGTAAQHAAAGAPAIGVIPVTDPFWSLPIVGDAWGETYRRTGQAAAWLLEVSAGVAVRRWPDRQPYLDHGAPPIVDLPAAHPFWSLPVVGALPPEGA